jgi:excisionase family DNA binding protein
MTSKQKADDGHDIAGTTPARFEDLPAEPICVRVATAVKLTGIPRSTLYELIGSGEIETAKIGRSTFIFYASLKRLFETH